MFHFDWQGNVGQFQTDTKDLFGKGGPRKWSHLACETKIALHKIKMQRSTREHRAASIARRSSEVVLYSDKFGQVSVMSGELSIPSLALCSLCWLATDKMPVEPPRLRKRKRKVLYQVYPVVSFHKFLCLKRVYIYFDPVCKKCDTGFKQIECILGNGRTYIIWQKSLRSQKLTHECIICNFLLIG